MTDRPLFGERSAGILRKNRQAAFLRQKKQTVNRLPKELPLPRTPVAANPGAPLAGPAPVQPTQPGVRAPGPGVAATQQGTINNRRHKRMRTLKGGMIILPGQMATSFGCKIRNESVSGAMLNVSATAILPGEFYLVRDSDPSHKTPCRVAWRSVDSLGVEFINQLSSE